MATVNIRRDVDDKFYVSVRALNQHDRRPAGLLVATLL
jgi:hypothetical protein